MAPPDEAGFVEGRVRPECAAFGSPAPEAFRELAVAAGRPPESTPTPTSRGARCTDRAGDFDVAGRAAPLGDCIGGSALTCGAGPNSLSLPSTPGLRRRNKSSVSPAGGEELVVAAGGGLSRSAAAAPVPGTALTANTIAIDLARPQAAIDGLGDSPQPRPAPPRLRPHGPTRAPPALGTINLIADPRRHPPGATVERPPAAPARVRHELPTPAQARRQRPAHVGSPLHDLPHSIVLSTPPT